MNPSLDDLSTAQAWLQSLHPLPTAVVEELRHRYEVSLTHHSTAIEGNTLTKSETQIVIEKGITIGGKSLTEHLEVIGHKEALDFVLEVVSGDSQFTEREIREIHSLVMKGQANGDNGKYRNLDVKAAGTDYVYPAYLKVPDLMTQFMEWLNYPSDLHPVEFASEANARFVTVHPFRDGNGRVGRLLLNLILLRSGYPITVLEVGQRSEYIDALEAFQSENSRIALDSLITHAVSKSLRDTLTTALSSSSIHLKDSEKQTMLTWLDEHKW